MNYDEYEQWLRQLVEDGRLEAAACDELLEQRRVFDFNRNTFVHSYPGKVVAVIDREVVVYNTVSELMRKEAHGDHQIYYESIPETSTAVPPVATGPLQASIC